MSLVADYRVYPLISSLETVECQEGLVQVKWADQRLSPFHHLWLRDNCPCSECVYGVTREQVFEIADAPEDLRAQSVEIDPEGLLLIHWEDGHRSRFEPGWLRAHAYDDASRQEQLERRGRKHYWTHDLDLPVFD